MLQLSWKYKIVHSIILSRMMSVFTKKLNLLSGAAEWVLQDEGYDFHQEIARSAFADMLHDSERNDKYYAAIKKVIEQTHKAGKKANVLDIGTGTGLLAMMAARSGADTVYACEAFSPISECAERVIAENGLSDCITVIHKRSTDMTAGEGGDLPQRANILVTEVFDTELIGEGAIFTFNHAHKHLLEDGCLVVPTSGTVYAQVADSQFMQRWNHLAAWRSVKPSYAITRCPGAAAVHDMQLSQVPPTRFKTISPPVEVFRFDWTGRCPIPEKDATSTTFVAEIDGKAEMVLMWWSLDMDPQGEIVLSCGPWWAHPDKPLGRDSLPWRDHWMQAIYYLPTSVSVTRGHELNLHSHHDEFSLWFNIGDTLKEHPRPVCDCMLHVSCSRTRLGMLNDPRRRSKYEHALQRLVTSQSIVLSLGDTSLLGLLTASLGARHVYHLEENVTSREVLEKLVKDNNLKSKVTILDSTKFSEKVKSTVNLVVGEPYFLNTLYPWDILRFWFLRQQCPQAACLPVAATLHALPMQFDHLYKIRAPLGTISGFTMDPFDKLIQDSSEVSDSRLEVQPLWEYPGIALANSHQLMRFDLTSPPPPDQLEAQGVIPLSVEGTCHGVALWMDVHLDSENTVTSGPLTSVTPGTVRPEFDPYTRQGLYFLVPQVPVTSTSNLFYSATFNCTSGEMDISFEVKTS